MSCDNADGVEQEAEWEANYKHRSETKEYYSLRPIGELETMLAPYDEGVFHGAQAIGEAMVTSPLQTFLDLKQIKGRGEEAADFLKKQVIEPKWAT